MYQFDTSLAVYALKQAEVVFSQSNEMFVKMIDDSLEFNRAMMNFEFFDMVPTDTLATLFPSVTASGAKKNQRGLSEYRKPKRLHRRRFVLTT